MNFRATPLRRLALAVLALGLSAQASAGWYQVEVMIIAHQKSTATGEAGRQLPYPDYPAEAVSLGISDAPRLPEQASAALHDVAQQAISNGAWQAGSDALTLTEMAQRMTQTGQYRVLFHQRWRQPVDDGAPAIPVHLEGGEQLAAPVVMHLGGLEDNAQPYTTEPEPEPEPELQGTLHLSLSRSLQVDTNLWLAGIDDGGQRYFSPMRESRRLGAGELHYLDSPRLGVLIRVSP